MVFCAGYTLEKFELQRLFSGKVKASLIRESSSAMFVAMSFSLFSYT